MASTETSFPVERSCAVSSFSHSGEIAKLAEALAKASADFKTPKKSSENPFFKSAYADLAELIEATRPALSKNGLSVIQFPGKLNRDSDSWRVEITTMLLHASGEWLRGESEMPCAKRDAQGLGSAETYGRRYAYQAMLSLAAEDDDGSLASGKKKPLSPEEDKAFAEDFDQRTADQQCITPMQQTGIQNAMKDSGKTEEDLVTYLKLAGYKRLEHVLKTDFNELIKWAHAKPKAPVGLTTLAKPLAGPPVKSGAHNWAALYAKAKEKGVPQEDIKRYYTDTYKVASGNDLSVKQFAEVVAWVHSLQS
jgi:hypothetical protein